MKTYKIIEKTYDFTNGHKLRVVKRNLAESELASALTVYRSLGLDVSVDYED